MVIDTSAKERSEAFARLVRSRMGELRSQKPELTSQADVANFIGMPVSTFTNIINAKKDPSSKQPKTVRRLARMGITEDEIKTCGFAVMGMPSEERQPIFENAKACLDQLVEGNGSHPVTSEDVYYMMSPEIVESYDVPTLLPVIRDAMSNEVGRQEWSFRATGGQDRVDDPAARGPQGDPAAAMGGALVRRDRRGQGGAARRARGRH